MADLTPAEDILKDYHTHLTLYNNFTNRMHELITHLLETQGIRVHSVLSRLKSEESLRNKLSKEEDKYTKFQQVTDIAGLRIITYFPDEVDAVARLLEAEFEIDRENTIDKRASLDPDRFGYLSLHYVVKLKEDRLHLSENKIFDQCVLEIQIRSILQHAWAEIEHDLGYKSPAAIPDSIRRKFSRLAGLLELADDQFAEIRDQVKAYTAEVNVQISDAPEQLKLDQVTLKAWFQTSELRLELDRAIAKDAKRTLDPRGDIDSWGSEYAEKLKYLGISTIEQLNRTIEERFKEIASLAVKVLIRRERKQDEQKLSIGEGIGVNSLCYVHALRSNDPNALVNFFNKYSIGDSETTRAQVADRISGYYAEVISQKQ